MSFLLFSSNKLSLWPLWTDLHQTVVIEHALTVVFLRILLAVGSIKRPVLSNLLSEDVIYHAVHFLEVFLQRGETSKALRWARGGSLVLSGASLICWLILEALLIGFGLSLIVSIFLGLAMSCLFLSIILWIRNSWAILFIHTSWCQMLLRHLSTAQSHLLDLSLLQSANRSSLRVEQIPSKTFRASSKTEPVAIKDCLMTSS